jgi:hypothetical protein
VANTTIDGIYAGELIRSVQLLPSMYIMNPSRLHTPLYTLRDSQLIDGYSGRVRRRIEIELPTCINLHLDILTLHAIVIQVRVFSGGSRCRSVVLRKRSTASTFVGLPRTFVRSRAAPRCAKPRYTARQDVFQTTTGCPDDLIVSAYQYLVLRSRVE